MTHRGARCGDGRLRLPFIGIPAFMAVVTRSTGLAVPLAGLAPASVSVAAVLAWSILPAVAAVALFRRLDINE